MKNLLPEVLEKYRNVHPLLGVSPKGSMYGYFRIKYSGKVFHIISSGPIDGWEHVSVSINEGKKLPNWNDMDWVKGLFWDENEVVVQYHISDDRKVDNAQVLHLWKQIDKDFPLPPRYMV